MEQAISIQHFSKRYQEFSIEDMNLEIPRGFITGFVGRNGAGKSTTIKAILNMIRYDGEIRVLGDSVAEKEIEVKNRLGVLLSADGFVEDIPVKQFIRVVAPFYRDWDQGMVEHYCRTFELSLDKKVKELSRGMRVKLGLALALSHGAELFILDEPTAGLDPMVRDEILDIFMDLIQDERKTIFFSTHITSDLDKVADYIVLIEHGKILMNQPKDQMLDDHVLVRGDRDALSEEMKKHLIGYKEHGVGFEGLGLAEGLPNGEHVLAERPNVEQMMMYYVRGLEQGMDEREAF